MKRLIVLLVICARFVSATTVGSSPVLGKNSGAPPLNEGATSEPFQTNRVSVKDWGAKGDGSTDDTAAINAAIAAGGGGVVYLPKGTYSVTGLNSPAANTRLLGAGRHATTIKRLNQSGSKPLLMFSNLGASVSSLKIDGNRANNPGITAVELNLAADDTSADNIEIINSEHISIEIDGMRNKLTDCKLNGSASATTGAKYGVWLNQETAIDDVISKCTFSDYRWAAVFSGGTGAVRLIVQNSSFSNNHRQVSPTGGGQLALRGTGHVVTGNTFVASKGSKASGLELDCESTTVTENKLKGGKVNVWGIILQSGSKYTIVGNKITGYTVAGIQINDGVVGFRIIGNDLKGNAVALVDNSSTADKSLSGNAFNAMDIPPS
jgi:Pectate lyase superfamily protein